MKKCFLLVVFVCLGSVASCTRYAIPEDAKLATLRLVSTTSDNVVIYKDKEWEHISCDFDEYEELAVLGMAANSIVNRGGGRDLDMPLKRTEVPAIQQSEVQVEAGKPFSFSFHNQSLFKMHIFPPGYTWNHCMQKIVFTPLENRMYEAVYDVPDPDIPDICEAKLYEIIESNGVFTRSEHTDYTNRGGTCRSRT